MSVLTPSSLDEVLTRLGERPDALVLSGGTDVMVEINMAHRPAPGDVVALRRVDELRRWRHDPATGVGAAAR